MPWLDVLRDSKLERGEKRAVTFVTVFLNATVSSVGGVTPHDWSGAQVEGHSIRDGTDI